jgi:hypothetical protein
MVGPTCVGSACVVLKQHCKMRCSFLYESKRTLLTFFV